MPKVEALTANPITPGSASNAVTSWGRSACEPNRSISVRKLITATIVERRTTSRGRSPLSAPFTK